MTNMKMLKKATDTTKYYKVLESSAILYSLDEYLEEDKKSIERINIAEPDPEGEKTIMQKVYYCMKSYKGCVLI